MKKLLFGFLALILLSLVGGRFAYGYLEENEWFVNRSLPIADILNQDHKTSDSSIKTAVQTNLEGTDFSELQDPFNFEPEYFYKPSRQPYIVPDDENKFVYQYYTYQLMTYPTIQSLRSYTWIMYAHNNFLSKAMVNSQGAENYISFLEELSQASDEQAQNPALIWIFLDRVAELNPSYFDQEVDVSQVVSNFAQAEQKFQEQSVYSNDELATKIDALPWTVAGKQLLYFSWHSFSLELTEQIFSQAGWYDQNYDQTFIKPFANETYKFSFLASGYESSAEEYYTNLESNNLDFTICHYSRAYRCHILPPNRDDHLQEFDGTWLECEKDALIDPFCPSNWLPNIREL